MTRVKRGVTARKKHKKWLALAKGYSGARSKCFRSAKQAVIKSLQYSYIGRKRKKRDFRALWIIRINAAVRMHDLSYSKFIRMTKLCNCNIDRKVLADIAMNDPVAFRNIVVDLKEKTEKIEKKSE